MGSIGAGKKKHADVRLDYVIDYSEPLTAFANDEGTARTGYVFMDSPGNDLESIAGQVAAGSNVIYFTTGNGSITNFPFVPTVKLVTSSGRFKLMQTDMDVNAGEYLDGRPMESCGADLVDLTLAVAGGQRTLGEKAGHSQVSIWRNWALAAGQTLDDVQREERKRG